MLSNYLEQKLVEHVLLNIPYTPPSQIYISLHTGSPGDTNNTSTEVSGGVGYSRQLATFTFGEVYIEALLSSDVTFGPATGSWGTITYVGLYDSLTGGNLLHYGALSPSKTVIINDTLIVKAGDLKVSHD